MIHCHARCVHGPTGSFEPLDIQRRNPGPHDVLIDIAYAGICHSDIDHVRRGPGKSHYPLVPGHEIAGIVAAVGGAVTKFRVGDRVGVGNMVDSCRECEHCKAGRENYCTRRVLTYNAIGFDGQVTQGGYSEKVVVDERFVLRIPDSIPLQNAAPLFCAGITLYSALKHWQTGPGKHVAIVGFGGLGHVGVQIARAMGATVTVLELAEAKRADALRLGATDFRLVNEEGVMRDLKERFDLIISTVPANLDVNAYLGLLGVDGTYVSLSTRLKPLEVDPAALAATRRSIAGTRSGGLPETQEMIDFCARHGVVAEVEVIDAERIDEAYERLERGDVRYRFVIDVKTMAKG